MKQQTPLMLSLWHPFTPNSVGLAEKNVRAIHSKPHVAALRYLTTQNWNCRVEYLSMAHLPHQERDDAMQWRFWPIARSWRTLRRTPYFRKEWSNIALANLLIAPPDLLVINMSGYNSPFTYTMARLVAQRNRPYMAMLGGHNVPLTAVQVRYFQGAACIITHTRKHKEQLEQSPQLAQCPIVTLPLGADCHYFQPDSNRKPLGNPGLLYVGRWVEWKGLHLVVDAFATVRQHYPEAILHLVGPESDPEYAACVRRQISELRLDAAVQIHGTVPYDQLRNWYQAADLFLLLSQPGGESFGMVTIESMACGTPVVALQAERGGPAEIITHGVDGLLTQPDQAGMEIVRLLQEPARLQAMRDQARLKAVAQYSQEVTTNTFKDIVADVVARTRSKHR